MLLEFKQSYEKKNTDLTSILKTEFEISQELQKRLDKNIIEKSNISLLKRSFKEYLLKEIISTGLEKNLLLGGLYIEDLLGKIFNPDYIKNFYIIDYLTEFEKSKDPSYLQHGGDIAFIKGSIFPGKQKMIRKKDYLNIAKHLYYSRYKHTEKSIGKILYWNLDFYAKNLENFLKI